jgi:hypothetical protein
MRFKKDGKVYESTEAMLNANCNSIATCMTECEIRKRCREGQSCEDYAYVNPAEVAQYLGFEVLEDDSPTIAMIIAKHTENDTPTIAETVEENGEDEKRRLTRADILHAAEKCVCGQREQDYGTPEDNFKAIAELWESYLNKACTRGVNVRVEAKDVAVMMALLKIARIAAGGGKADSWIDLAGYAACGAECEGVTE